MTDQELAEYDDCELEVLDDRWAAPMTFSDVKHLYETLPGERMSGGVDDGKDVPADWNRRVSEAEDKARVAAEAKEKARVAAEAKARVAAEAKEQARVAAEAKEQALVADRIEKAPVATEEWWDKCVTAYEEAQAIESETP